MDVFRALELKCSEYYTKSQAYDKGNYRPAHENLMHRSSDRGTRCGWSDQNVGSSLNCVRRIEIVAKHDGVPLRDFDVVNNCFPREGVVFDGPTIFSHEHTYFHVHRSVRHILR